MDKNEYDHFHGYQDRKDALEDRINVRSLEIFEDLWDSNAAIMEALKESLSESDDYAALVKYCRRGDAMKLLGIITHELIDIYLSEQADQLAEDEINA